MSLNDSDKTYSDDQSAVADILNNGGVQGSLIVGTTPIEVKVGVNRLTGRKVVTLYNNSNNVIYWGFTNSVSVLNGTPIEKKQFVQWNVGDITELWVVADSSNNNTRITEAA